MEKNKTVRRGGSISIIIVYIVPNIVIMKFKLFILCAFLILSAQSYTSTEIQNSVTMLIDKNCGADFAKSTASYCSHVDKYEAAAILALLCGQDLIST